ncbi:MAG: TrkA family potassium uptake protein [Ilumatobacteraceae bacterium]
MADTAGTRDIAEYRNTGPVLIVGLGRFGGSVARTLASMGVEVMAVDTDARLVQAYSRDLSHVVQADATDDAALRQLGVSEIDTAIIAIGTGVESSVLVTAALVDLGVRRVWAKAISDQHANILRRVGAHRVFLPEHEMGERVAHIVAGTMLEYLSLDAGFALAEIVAPASIVGRTLGELGLRATHGVTVVCVKHPGEGFTYAEATTRVLDNDLLMIAGAPADIDRIVSLM